LEAFPNDIKPRIALKDPCASAMPSIALRVLGQADH
jgi:hypothetical protein